MVVAHDAIALLQH